MQTAKLDQRSTRSCAILRGGDSAQGSITIKTVCPGGKAWAITESTVQWLLHRRMNAQQQMRWSPRGAHSMLKVRTAVLNGTLDRDHAVAERWSRRPFQRAA
jgi:hypothetical protein